VSADGSGGPLLPPEFADLAPALDWALPTERQRYLKRMNSSMDEMNAFYDLVFRRAAEARDYLDRFELSSMTPDQQHLMWILFSLITVSFAVDVFGVPRVPDTASAYVERSGEPPTYPV
jgi:hypothetical protein